MYVYMYTCVYLHNLHTHVHVHICTYMTYMYSSHLAYIYVCMSISLYTYENYTVYISDGDMSVLLIQQRSQTSNAVTAAATANPITKARHNSH